MKTMKERLKNCRQFLARYKTLLLPFWRYAIAAKCRPTNYRSKKIMLMRLDLIGDCTMFTSTAKAIREYYHDREMVMVCLESTKPVFERLGIFDRIITMKCKPEAIDRNELKRLMAVLRDDTYDLLLQPQASTHPVADVLVAGVKCNQRIAIETKPGNSGADWVRMKNFLYDRLIEYPRGVVSEFDYYGAFARGLGISGFRTTCPCLPYGEQHFIPESYYVFYPGGSFSQKFWAGEKFAKLAEHIYRKTGLTCVILGVASEQWASDIVKQNLGPLAAIAMRDLTGKTSISDVMDIIGNAEFVVSNDTSGVHISCATHTPSVAIAGGWHYRRFLPYHIEDIRQGDQLPLVAFTKMPCYHCDWDWSVIGQCNAHCLERMKRNETSECIDRVSYEQVRDLVDQVMKAGGLC